MNAYNVATSFYSQKANIWLYWQIGLFIMAVGSLSLTLSCMALSIYSISFQMERTVMTWAPSLVCLIDWLHVWAFDLGTPTERCLFFLSFLPLPRKEKRSRRRYGIESKEKEEISAADSPFK